MRTWQTWTQKEILRLEDLREQGLSAPAIAARLGRTVASIRSRLTEEKIVKPRDGRYVTAFTGPHTITGLAKRFRVGKHAVKQAKRRLRRAGVDGILPAIREPQPQPCAKS